MIIDSKAWKKEIENQVKVITLFLKKIPNETFDDGSTLFIELQKFTIYTAIILRKLIEAKKISDELMSENFPIVKFMKNQKKITIFNYYEIEKLYDLSSSEISSISLKKLSDSIIHSYHFLLHLDKNNAEKYPIGFYFSSDFTKEIEINFITLEQYFKILNKVIFDFITFVEIGAGKINRVSTKKSKEV